MLLSPLSRAKTALTVGLMALVATTIFAQQASTTTAADQDTAKYVSSMISKFHISQKPLDDRISAMLVQRFVKELDPQKLYFVKPDIDGFAKYRDHLDDYLKQGKADFGYEVFALYLKRLDERLAVAHKLIDAPHDFALDESMVIDGQRTLAQACQV